MSLALSRNLGALGLHTLEMGAPCPISYMYYTVECGRSVSKT